MAFGPTTYTGTVLKRCAQTIVLIFAYLSKPILPFDYYEGVARGGADFWWHVKRQPSEKSRFHISGQIAHACRSVNIR
jgi:hypothetical protein